MRRKMFLVLVSQIILFWSLNAIAEERLTLETYYPSPWGSYRELEVNGRARLAIPNIPVFDNNTYRDNAITKPEEGDLVFNKKGGTNPSDWRLQICISDGAKLKWYNINTTCEEDR